MIRATVTIPDELEKALDSYRKDLGFPPSLAAVMQASLEEYLRGRGYTALAEPDTTQRPTVYEGAPTVRGEKTAAQIVVEDRR